MHPGQRLSRVIGSRSGDGVSLPFTASTPFREPGQIPHGTREGVLAGYIRATDDLLSQGGQSLNSIFADCFSDWFIGIPFVGDNVMAKCISKLH